MPNNLYRYFDNFFSKDGGIDAGLNNRSANIHLEGLAQKKSVGKQMVNQTREVVKRKKPAKRLYAIHEPKVALIK